MGLAERPGRLGMTARQDDLDLGLDLPAPRRGQKETRLPRLAAALERGGVVYTRPWVAEMILDLVGYRPEADLADRYAV